MKVIYKYKGAGKTEKLIKECCKNHGCIVCHSTTEAKYIWQKAQIMGYPIVEPITYKQFIRKTYIGTRPMTCFYIDNVDGLLQSMTNFPIKAVTVTKN